MKNFRSCDLCGATPDQAAKTWPEAEAGSASEGYVTCKSCGLVFANPLPGAGDLVAFHAKQYAAEATEQIPDRLHKLDPEHSQKRLYSEAYQRWAKNLLLELKEHARTPNAPRFLEVGCAAGGVLKAARDLGMPAVGTEVSPESAAYGISKEQLDIRIGVLEDLKLPAAAFDIVLLHDVFEHVPSPKQTITECARLMAPGGVICIHTVNVDSLTARVARADFFLADTTGGHATLRRYCRDAGLDPFEVTTRGFRIVQRERDREAMGWNRAFVRLAENIGHEVVKPFGLGHFIQVVARK